MKAERNTFMLGPSAQFQSETSSVVMNLNAIFHLRGICLSIGAACASGSHAIGYAKFLINHGAQDLILAGGSIELNMHNTIQKIMMVMLFWHIHIYYKIILK